MIQEVATKENAVITIISITIIVLNMMMIIVQVIKNVIMAGVTVAIMAVTTMEVMAVTTVEVMAATTADIMAVTTMEGITMVTTVAADITAVVKNVIAAKDVTAAGAGFFNTRALKQQKELKKLSSFFCKLKLINGILRIYSKCILEEEKNV
ncbi:hypothetical protein B1R96_10775 [Priestia aryabhattai]|uniref:hypothetical protein n=1 Tax=Priestia aryabhattai TaxID=412384 RepID=UPI000B743B81|nr:hypothetical protein [Priestia aryabhattai]OUT31276.1 hypothetical protein B1R96_10775 [Priestia aryabhattai]